MTTNKESGNHYLIIGLFLLGTLECNRICMIISDTFIDYDLDVFLNTRHDEIEVTNPIAAELFALAGFKVEEVQA